MSDDNSPVMNWNEGQEEAEYRKISVGALISLLLGLVSLTAFASSVMWIVPFVTILVAALAVIRIRRNRDLSGGSLATFALLLGAFAAVGAPAQAISRRSRLERTAQTHFDYWVELVHEGKLPQAHQLTQRYNDREPRGADLQAVYSKDLVPPDMGGEETNLITMGMLMSNSSDMAGFFGHGAAKVLADPHAQPEYLGLVNVKRKDRVDTVVLRYEISFSRDGKNHTEPFDVYMERAIEPNQEAHWRLEHLEWVSFAELPPDPDAIMQPNP